MIVRNLVKEVKSSILMLQEIKLKKHQAKNMVKRIWKEAHYEVIGVVGKLGRLWIMLDPL